MNHFNSEFANDVRPVASESGYSELERFSQAPENAEAVVTEFGAALDGLDDVLSRRRWLQLMGASLALGAASTGCRYQEEKIAPYAFRPHNRTPGEAVKYATMIDFEGVARPLEAVSYDGRPIKLDGNRLHEDSLGASDTFTQARILELYDPERLRAPLTRANETLTESNWQAFAEAGRKILSGSDLSGVAIIAEPTSSPTLLRIKSQFEGRGGKWYAFTSFSDDNAREGSRLAFGQVVRPQYHLDKAKVIVCLDADPLKFDPASIRNSRKFAAGRDAEHGKMSRLYVVECANSITGSSADHRMSLPVGKIASFLGALADEVAKRTAGGSVDKSLPYRSRLLAAMAQDLRDNAGAGVVITGESQPAAVHAAVHRLNSELNNIGATIEFTTPLDADRVDALAGIGQLAESIKSGTVKSLIVVGGNPAYGAPAELDFGKLMSSVDNAIHLAVHKNETSLQCDWVYNLAHPLEVWGDGKSHDGSHCLAQPLILPLFGGKSEIEVLASLIGSTDVDGLSLVQETAKSLIADADFTTAWNRAIHDGFVVGSAAKLVATSLAQVEFPANDNDWQKRWKDGPIDMVFIPSLSVHDGRFANNAWLQELPDFITKLTWENAALVDPKTARKLGLKQDTKYTFEVDGKTIELPVHIQPGQALGTMAVAIGYGRTAAGRVGGDDQAGVTVTGKAVNHLRTTAAWHGVSGVKSTSRGAGYRLAATQEKWDIDNTGRGEIQDRMFMNSDGKRSGLIREGSYESYSAFMAHQAEHNHDADANKHSSLPKSGFLPVVNSRFVPADAEVAKKSGDNHSHKDEHHAQWPENFHIHHKLFDLTPGVREIYGQENPELKNVWGMSIDLNKCTGCSACVIACQSENNIPVVGKEQVQRHRQMQWMRIDSYFGNNLYNKEAAQDDDKMLVHQPVTCHHCENAPCETVCPVAATTHSSEGLNDMVYNRCIGTRYCGNNCPYKVRRFNYFNYSDAVTFLKYPGADKVSPADRAIQNMMMNPEVTIRSRGVMEKCTYCVQRIQNTKIKAKNEHRALGANEITTACQDVCPTQAIKFGDLNHAESEVRAAHKNPRAYVMLEELNNRPRTRYLARVRNPHPSLVDWDDRYGSKHAEEKTTANESKA